MKYDWHEHVVRVCFSRTEKNIEVREPKIGLRHNKQTIYVKHRFPVKNGIDDAEHIYRIMCQVNPLFEYLRNKSGDGK